MEGCSPLVTIRIHIPINHLMEEKEGTKNDTNFRTQTRKPSHYQRPVHCVLGMNVQLVWRGSSCNSYWKWDLESGPHTMVTLASSCNRVVGICCIKFYKHGTCHSVQRVLIARIVHQPGPNIQVTGAGLPNATSFLQKVVVPLLSPGWKNGWCIYLIYTIIT